MDTFLVQQVAFWWAKYKIKPAIIVDKIIEIAVDLIVPPRADNDASRPTGWLLNQFSTVDRSLEKQQRASEIRSDLRRWDRDNPELRHEMIVSTLVSGILSILVTNVYLSFCRRIRDHNRR